MKRDLVNKISSLFKRLPFKHADTTVATDEYAGAPGTLLWKVERFIARQWVKVFIAFSVALVCMAFAVMNAQTQATRSVEEMRELLQAHLNKVLVATPDGRLVAVTRIPINAQLLKSQVENFIQYYLLLDKLAFMVSDQIGFARNLEEAMGLPRVSVLRQFFDEKSMQQYEAYIKYLYSSMVSDQLPEIIKPVDFRNVKFDCDIDSFEYEGDVFCRTAYVGIDQKWHYGTGTIHVRLRGKFEPMKASQDNPYGLKITGLYVKYIQKPET